MVDPKYKILELLRAERPGYVSGEFICQQLGVSRTAIWKNVESLRQDGYEIEAKPRAGYRLILSPDTVRPVEWLHDLSSQIIGLNTHYVRATSSTNDLAKEIAKQGAPDGTVVLAEEQTAGRGRLGRSWQCPARTGLCFSVVLQPKVSPMEVTQLTMMSAVAVAKVLEGALGVPARVKWPNDIYINGLKVCGILAEMLAESDRVKFIVLGIGINVNQSKDDLGQLEDLATSLRLQKGSIISRVEILKKILEEMDYLYIKWRTEGFAPLKNMWEELALWLGCQVTVSGLHRLWEGEMDGIDEYGALIIKLSDGTRQTFYSGDVSLRKSG